MYPDDDGALTLTFSRGEIDMEDLAGNLYKTRGILFEKCAPQAHSGHGKVERVIRSLQECLSRSGASRSRLTATGWSTVAKAIEREVNDVPIGFLFDKTSAGGNPILRILKPSSLKGMNMSDRAPKGLFVVPDLPQKHFGKVQECYDLWYRCWATSFLPLIIKSQKWHDDDEPINVNDIVYFKLRDSPMKAEWRIGKIDSIKRGRDEKIREVNVAYKIFKEDSDEWQHNVVTRPVRELVKLFEVGDTTFAEDVASVQAAAREILLKRGCLQSHVVRCHIGNDPTLLVSDSSLADEEEIKLYDKHLPFLNCMDAYSWTYGNRIEDGHSYQNVFGFKDNDLHYDTYNDENEIIFLI